MTAPDRRAVHATLGAFFLIGAPFVGFLKYHEYPMLTPEVFALTVGAGLFVLPLLATTNRPVIRAILVGIVLLVFIDLQFDLERRISFRFTPLFAIVPVVLGRAFLEKILLVAGGSLLAASILIPLPRTVTPPPLPTTTHVADTSSAPPVLHLVLDELASLDALADGLDDRNRVDSTVGVTLAARGFTVLPTVFAAYPQTRFSLAHAFNLGRKDDVRRFVRDFPEGDSRGPPSSLVRSAYHQGLADTGYHFSVLQSSFLNFCSVPNTVVARCRTYPLNTIRYIREPEISGYRRALLLGAYFFGNESHIFTRIRRRYRFAYLTWFGSRDPAQPGAWDWNGTAIGPPLDRLLAYLQSDLTDVPRGRYTLAHLLRPHHPFERNADCSYNPRISDHLRDSSPGAEILSGATNTPASRQARYRLYGEQWTCNISQLADLFDELADSGILDSMYVVLHGDHGTRVGLNPPTVAHKDDFSRQDVLDHYTTMVAVRPPGGGRLPDLEALARDGAFLSEVFDWLSQRLTGRSVSEGSVSQNIHWVLGADPPAPLDLAKYPGLTKD